MNVILGEHNIIGIKDRYVVLELDLFRHSITGDLVTAYGLVEKLSVADVLDLETYIDLHANLIKNYRSQNWNYCDQAIEHLRGKWQGEYDSYYDNLAQRVTSLKTQDLDQDWDGAIIKDWYVKTAD
jgi:hypothetical protein